MTVFAVRRSQTPYFRELDLDALDVYSYAPDTVELDDVLKFYEVNLSMSNWWQTISCAFYDEPNDQDKGIGDICLWSGASLVLSRRAYNLLKDSIQPFGEFLPLSIANEPYYIFNCLSYGIDDLEACESEHQQGHRLWVTKLVTEPKDEKQLLFKSKYDRGHTLLCSKRFTDIVNQLGLTGLSFDAELVRKFDL